jgi:CheY-like chemotaxis protein
VVLADYHLDKSTGFEAIERIRQFHHGALPAVLITADRSEEVRAQATTLDIPVINKPVKPAALRAVMSRLHRVPAAAE